MQRIYGTLWALISKFKIGKMGYFKNIYVTTEIEELIVGISLNKNTNKSSQNQPKQQAAPH